MKKLVSMGLLVLGMGVTGIATAAFFNDLTIHNDTNTPSTSKINGGLCSSNPVVLGKDGITQPHSTNVIKGYKVFAACVANRENCQAAVYPSVDCEKSGKSPIAQVIFSVTSGIKSFDVLDTSYQFNKAGPFEISVTGGPAAK